ncbi:hypothetical protein ACFOUP_14755 [Belliella kenyensis]|uniref:CHAD domain-containing protein n=1 Tax=Belliella kenyensis TaxID=1472724 RepID=A0ABV8EPW3_9BACT|nr:hypothetical protein [Belliella kenyensis]MCH7403417.1 hypothetical protein [Belliella kenyensis]MDN3601629.1 hypothetical protein [Belliella kenyensis]
MSEKLSPLFLLFQAQFEEAHKHFLSLGKEYKAKKAIELEQKLIFLDIFTDLIGKIQFQNPALKFELFGPLNQMFKGVKKTKHLKFIQEQLAKISQEQDLTFGSYEKHILEEKKSHYNKAYDLIVGTSLGTWENYYAEVKKISKSIKPLALNTATTQMINEELDFLALDHRRKLDSKAMKDIYEGIRVVIAVENIRIKSGFNPVFVKEVHVKMAQIQQDLLAWYQNHLILQHLVYYFGDKEEISKKYQDLLSLLKARKKKLTQTVEKQCEFLFDKILD